MDFWVLTMNLVTVFWSYKSFFRIWVFYDEFKGAENLQVVIALNIGCGSNWRFWIGVLDIDVDFGF